MRASAALPVLLAIFVSGPALSSDGAIDIVRGPERVVYGSCVPSLVVENKSSETIDYLQVDVLLTLSDGQQRMVELKSAYREGVLRPMAPGASARLEQHLDTSRAVGVLCSDIKGWAVQQTICEARGAACTVPVSIRP